MRKVTLLAVLMLIVLLGCKKEAVVEEDKSTEAVYFVKFKVDGVQKRYTGYTIAQPVNYLETNNFFYTAIAGGTNEYENDKNWMQFEMAIPSKLVMGRTYVNYLTAELGVEKSAFLWFHYKDEKGIQFDSVDEEMSVFLYNTKPNGSVKFLEIGKDFIKGVFSVTVYNSDYTKSIKITEGEFYIKRSDSYQG